MFENITELEDVAYIGINPIKSVVECIEQNDDDKKMVCNLANGAMGMLGDLYKCIERLSEEQERHRKNDDRKQNAWVEKIKILLSN